MTAGRKQRFALMRFRGTLVIILVALVASGSASAAPGPNDPEVQACVRENSVRYDDPDEALVHQYVDIVAACIEALSGGSDIDMSIIPPGSVNPGTGSGAGTGESSRDGQGTDSKPSAQKQTENGEDSPSDEIASVPGDAEASPASTAAITGGSAWLKIVAGLALIAGLAGLAFEARRRAVRSE